MLFVFVLELLFVTRQPSFSFYSTFSSMGRTGMMRVESYSTVIGSMSLLVDTIEKTLRSDMFISSL